MSDLRRMLRALGVEPDACTLEALRYLGVHCANAWEVSEAELTRHGVPQSEARALLQCLHHSRELGQLLGARFARWMPLFIERRIDGGRLRRLGAHGLARLGVPAAAAAALVALVKSAREIREEEEDAALDATDASPARRQYFARGPPPTTGMALAYRPTPHARLPDAVLTDVGMVDPNLALTLGGRHTIGLGALSEDDGDDDDDDAALHRARGMRARRAAPLETLPAPSASLQLRGRRRGR